MEVGKHANLTVLDKSPYDVAPTAIKDIGFWGTMLEGRVQPAPAAPKAASNRDGDPEVASWPAEVPADALRRDTADVRRGDHGDGCDMARALAVAMTANTSPAGGLQ